MALPPVSMSVPAAQEDVMNTAKPFRSDTGEEGETQEKGGGGRDAEEGGTDTRTHTQGCTCDFLLRACGSAVDILSFEFAKFSFQLREIDYKLPKEVLLSLELALLHFSS